MLHSELTEEIIGACFQVHNHLGYGFLEQVYQNALYKELKWLGLKCDAQREIKVMYKGELVGRYKADIIVEDLVILELKAVRVLNPDHGTQLVNYLKATGIEVGLLLNFGHSMEIRRKVFTANYESETDMIVI